MNTTYEQYATAVAELVKMTLNHSGSGARAAAQVLLSAYNGSNWQLNVTDLCNLDGTNYGYVMTVIEGRRSLSCEPHTTLHDGQALFEKLQRKWARLHINNRWKEDCYSCDGHGQKFQEDEDHPEGGEWRDCQTCNSEGSIAKVSTFPAKAG